MRLDARIIIAVLFILPSFLMAQGVMPDLPADQIQKTFYPTAGPTLSPAAFINPAEPSDEVDWDVDLVQKGGIRHKVDKEDQLRMIKAQKTAEKIALEAENPTLPGSTSQDETETVTAVSPILLTSFEVLISLKKLRMYK